MLAPAPCLAGRQQARPPTGSPQNALRWVGVGSRSAALRLWLRTGQGGQRWHVLAEACTTWGGMRWVPGRWGQAPDAAVLSLCTLHTGPGAWFGAELPVGLTLFRTCRVLGLYLWGGRGLATSAQVPLKAPSKCSPTGNLGGDSSTGDGDVAWGCSQPGERPMGSSGRESGQAVGTRAAAQGLCF